MKLALAPVLAAVVQRRWMVEEGADVHRSQKCLEVQ